MLNKKILAASVVAAFSMNAQADIDLAAANPADPAVKFASETIGALTGGYATVTNLTNALDVQSPVGFSIGSGTNKYVRIDLDGAKFDVAPTLAVAASGGGAVPTTSVAQGGAAGDDFVIFEVTAGPLAADQVQAADEATLAAATYRIMPSGGSTVTFTLYETAGDAVNKTGALFTDMGPFTTVATASTGTFSVKNNVTATVASKFVAFKDRGDDIDAADANDDVKETLGNIDVDKLITGSFVKADGTAVAAADLHTASQVVTFAGDFSVGVWSLDTGNDCATGTAAALTLNTDKNVASSAAYTVATDAWLCVDNSAGTPKALNKGSYTATMVTDKLTNTLGAISYDTTSIAIPYLTTFSDYNQRVYIINSGSVDANYSTTFLSEAGVTEVAGSGATGTVPAGEMVAIKAVDIVTLTGKTRTSATIEIEAQAASISATTQTINLSDKSTDTVALTVTGPQ